MGMNKRSEMKGNSLGHGDHPHHKRHKSNKEGKKTKRSVDIPMFPRSLDPERTLDDQAFPRTLQPSTKDNSLEEVSHMVDLNSERRVRCYLTTSDLDIGSVVLGVIARYDDKEQEFEVHLPFHLRAFLPLEHTMEPTTDVEERYLCEFYSPGVRVICVVISQVKKKILVSVRPSIVNSGFSLSLFKIGMWLPVTITSLEEFGYTADFGLQEKITVYVKTPTVKKNHHESLCSLRSGCIVYVGITRIDYDQGAVYCSLCPTSDHLPFTTSVDISLIRPGFLVDCHVEQVICASQGKEGVPTGVKVAFCKVLKGIVPVLHSRRSLKTQGKDDSEDTFTSKEWAPGITLRARILAVNLTKKRILLSSVKSVVNWTQTMKDIPKLRIGSRVSSLQVIAVDKFYGARLLFSLGRYQLVADVANEQCYDEGKNYAKGGQENQTLVIHQRIPLARIVSFSVFECSYVVVTAPSLLSQPLLLPQDVTIGQKLQGVIKHISKKFIFVRLSPSLTGLLPHHHVTDVPLKELPQSIQLNQPIDVCVFAVYPHTVWLTAKKSLISYTLHNTSAHQKLYFSLNQLVTGVVGNLDERQPTRVPVHFFNGVNGFFPLEELKLFKKEHRYKTGSVVQCRVAQVDYFQKLRLSLNLTGKSASPDFVNPIKNLCFTVVQTLASFAEQFPQGFTLLNLWNFLDHQSSLPCLFSMNAEKNHESGSVLLYRVVTWRVFQYLVHTHDTFFDILYVFGGVDMDCLVVLFSLRPDLTRHECLLPVLKNSKDESWKTNLEALDPFPIGVGLLPVSHLSDASLNHSGSRKMMSSNGTLENIKKLIHELKRVVVIDPQTSLDSLWDPQRPSEAKCSRLDVLQRDEKCTDKVKGVFISGKSSLITAAIHGNFIGHANDLVEHLMEWIPGFIFRRLKNSLIVCVGSSRVLGTVRGLPKGLGIDNFFLGQSVRVKIHQIDSTSRFSVFDCDIALWSENKPQENTKIDTLCSVGDLYEAKVTNTLSDGLELQLLPSLTTARLPFTELPESPIDPSLCTCLYPRDRCLPAVRVIDITHEVVVSCQPYLTRELYQTNDVVLGYVRSKSRQGLWLKVHLPGYTHPYFQRTAFCHVQDIQQKECKAKSLNPRQILAKYPIGFSVKAKVKGYKVNSDKILDVILLPSNTFIHLKE